MVVLLILLSSLQINAKSLSTKALYSNLLYLERAEVLSHLNFEGFLRNTIDYIPDKKASLNRKQGLKELPEYNIKEIEYLIGKIHNVMMDTFFHCTRRLPRARSFTEAVDGRHTPDSQHYASMIHSALSMKGIKTKFFQTPTHYGVYYSDKRTGERLFWCIITPLAMSKPAKNLKEYVAVFNKFKSPEINGRIKLTGRDIRLISVDEFAKKVM